MSYQLFYRIRQTHDINLLFVNLKGRQNDYTAQINVKNILKSMIVRSLFLIFHFSLYLCGWTITILNLYATDILSFMSDLTQFCLEMSKTNRYGYS